MYIAMASGKGGTGKTKAQNLFRQMNIEPIIGVTGKVDEVILDFLQEKLETGESTCDQGEAHHRQHH
jgi:MinD superfamily P-loop ATPase